LPDSICMLCNLQTLKLLGCKDLVVLPRDMNKLINLRHLDIAGTGIKEMPMQLGRLIFLQTLNKFVISKENPSCIGELGKLKNLRGKLSILELQNIVLPKDALDASLNETKDIEELELKWSASDAKFSKNQETILDSLRPHKNLKSLTINYNGRSFPNWVGDPLFSKIASLHLNNCINCCSMPPLGQLTSLQDLSVVGFHGVGTVGAEIYGNGSSSFEPFKALKVLRFEHMLNWEEWASYVSENEGGAFPLLQELYI
jgi:hypothetical protein